MCTKIYTIIKVAPGGDSFCLSSCSSSWCSSVPEGITPGEVTVASPGDKPVAALINC